MKHIYSFIFILLFCSVSHSQNPCSGTPTVDYEGKTYHTVQIGSQCWLKENLDVGKRIDGFYDQTNNGTIEKYCYNNDTVNCAKYGGLYQWNEAMQYIVKAGTIGICPTGWHIPDTSEFVKLVTTVNNDGNALKAIGQGTGSGAGTNTSGFSDLLGGYRTHDGSFINLSFCTYFWSSLGTTASYAYYMYLFFNDSYVYFINYYNINGYSVRCLKDGSTGINDHSNNTLQKSFDLSQNFPNPFNPNTTISFSLLEKSRIVLSVYNELGEKVAVLLNGEIASGSHSVEWNASRFVSGIYFYELKTDKFTSVKKLILMK